MLIKDIETLNHEKKIRGFFTVTVYIFAVSFLAILLSIYYIFVWTNPNIQAYCWYMKVHLNTVETTSTGTAEHLHKKLENKV